MSTSTTPIVMISADCHAGLVFLDEGRLGVMLALVGFSLSWIGYAEYVEQPASTINMMILLNGGIPFLCFIVGIALFTRFRLDSTEHQRLLEQIAARGPSGSPA
ncbi:MAG: hypothetical protein GY910_03250 [bacterium]|nr:hypothetical protein [Deltaproteobacteria bacterium]MCP4903973.1 hypothetical protein [bacterium]